MISKYFNKNIAILGFGLEGQDLVNYFQRVGAKITVYDEKQKSEHQVPENVKSTKFVFGKNAFKKGLEKHEYIFRSPGVYLYRDEIVAAADKGSIVSSATNLFLEETKATIIGVTGTKGKGTTCTLIYEILKEAGFDVHLAGNIGKPYLSLLPKLTKYSYVVLELSSFQLIDLVKSPHIAVILNISRDHLDWHKDVNEYISAKKNILNNQKEKDFAIINADYKVSSSFSNIGKGKKYYFSTKKLVEGSFVVNMHLHTNLDDKNIDIGSVEKLLLRGRHNWENVLAAITVASLLKIRINTIKKTLFSFRGLEHRLELVDEINGVKYYNDSFSTGPDPVIAAINSFIEPITLILGGYDKMLDYRKMVGHIKKTKNVINIILIGQLANKLENMLKSNSVNKNISNLGITSMRDIVKKTAEVTKDDGVVLLSPGAASFDMFKSYKERGLLFKKQVKILHNNG